MGKEKESSRFWETSLNKGRGGLCFLKYGITDSQKGWDQMGWTVYISWWWFVRKTCSDSLWIGFFLKMLQAFVLRATQYLCSCVQVLVTTWLLQLLPLNLPLNTPSKLFFQASPWTKDYRCCTCVSLTAPAHGTKLLCFHGTLDSIIQSRSWLWSFATQNG